MSTRRQRLTAIGQETSTDEDEEQRHDFHPLPRLAILDRHRTGCENNNSASLSKCEIATKTHLCHSFDEKKNPVTECFKIKRKTILNI
ncbi:hypothetical protein AVEN_245457-1 [Araneus ventricosus]|uniref:Uncharacterized protein n=1 Tax=Araneus ventricosus TaxID=182803 RepID=A0A4Y2BT44_ARAVE|nr:hypothetical protein AVEN_237513-1 [Araneus ventricosus]GBL94492.1 hypothetical protein AVEN_245457-1 [Araneus ventricosus]